MAVTSNSGDPGSPRRKPSLDLTMLNLFRRAFLKSSTVEQITNLDQFGDIPSVLLDVCLIFRYLIAMALDEFDRSSLDAVQGCLDIDLAETGDRLFISPPSIVHTGAILVILKLIPAVIYVQGHTSATLTLQVSYAFYLISLLL